MISFIATRHFMNLKMMHLVFLVWLLTGAFPALAQLKKQNPKQTTAPAPPASPQIDSAEIYELLRRAEDAVKQAQEEARRAREQSAELQQQLQQNTAELARLRQTITTLGMQLAEWKAERNAVPSAPSTATLEARTTAPATTQETIKSNLETLQEQVEVHAAQIKEHAQTKVESASKFRVKLHGMILVNTYLNTNDSTLNDVPLFARPPSATLRKNNLGATLRQTRLGFTFEGPSLSPAWGGARLSAETEFDFWGSETSEVLGGLRILTASARLDWKQTSLIVGQRPPLVSPRNPSSLAAMWFAPLAASGNLWQWRPQLMLEQRVRLGAASELQLQGGVLMPFGETLQGEVIEGGPGYESRLGWSRTLASESKIEFGVGGYFHRRPFSFGRQVNSYAITGDWQIPFGEKVTLSGEAFGGRAVNLGEASGFRNDRLYAVQGPLSNPATQIRGVYSAGGWAQLNFKAAPTLDFNFAYGQEDARNSDIFSGQFAPTIRLKNQVAMANFIWAVRQNFLVSLEYRRLWTDYLTARQQAGHYNLAFGYIF
jgi:hypothetical protein